MNKTKIEWCDDSWNPVTGCKHGCEYCYARRIASRFGGYDSSGGVTTFMPLKRAELSQPLTITRENGKTVNSPYPFGFEPTLHRYRLEEPARKTRPRTIFVCSMADLFGAWVPDEWIDAVFAACEKAPQHRYLFLTKNPARYEELRCKRKLPAKANFWYGSTITKPTTAFWSNNDFNTFLSIEPLLERFEERKAEDISPYGEPRWIILGAETGNRAGKVTPEKEWVDTICTAADLAHAAVFMKDSLIPVVGEENMRREYPWEVR